MVAKSEIMFMIKVAGAAFCDVFKIKNTKI